MGIVTKGTSVPMVSTRMKAYALAYLPVPRPLCSYLTLFYLSHDLKRRAYTALHFSVCCNPRLLNDFIGPGHIESRTIGFKASYRQRSDCTVRRIIHNHLMWSILPRIPLSGRVWDGLFLNAHLSYALPSRVFHWNALSG